MSCSSTAHPGFLGVGAGECAGALWKRGAMSVFHGFQQNDKPDKHEKQQALPVKSTVSFVGFHTKSFDASPRSLWSSCELECTVRRTLFNMLSKMKRPEKSLSPYWKCQFCQDSPGDIAYGFHRCRPHPAVPGRRHRFYMTGPNWSMRTRTLQRLFLVQGL